MSAPGRMRPTGRAGQCPQLEVERTQCGGDTDLLSSNYLIFLGNLSSPRDLTIENSPPRHENGLVARKIDTPLLTLQECADIDGGVSTGS
jgi:hypothetical protein